MSSDKKSLTCIFCDIVSSSAPAHKMYEDDACVAFLDTRPIRPGHSLIIPKTHVDHFFDLDDNTSHHLISVARKLSGKIREELTPLRVGIVISGFGVPHCHVHVIPLHSDHDITSSQYADKKTSEPVFAVENITPAKPTKLKMIRAKLNMMTP
ncbi:MAG: HIT family protein [Alphaproteobacteria bacterium]